MSKDAREQFGRQAQFYAISRSHSHGDSLSLVRQLAHPEKHHVVVDIGTGTGFTAFELAPSVHASIATDPALPMLHQTRRLSAERGLNNVQLAMAVGEALPFADNSIDIVTCRQAFHHFPELPQAIAEVFRALKPGGALVMGDTISPQDNSIAEWLNDVEKRRDPSHVYDLKVSEWQDLLASKAFQVTDIAMARTILEFSDWARRSGTSEAETATLRRDFLSAPPEVALQYNIKPSREKIDFTWDVAIIRALKPE